MDMASGHGTVRTEGNPVDTAIHAADCRQAGIEPVAGTRLLYRIGALPNGVTGAIELEPLG